MPLDVIGAGFGRTGTLSLKVALEQLGYNKTYHMAELFSNPEHLDSWEQVLASGHCDWNALFDGYRAAVDWPTCHYWRELAEYFPEAKIILSIRDSQSWYESVCNTIYPSTLKALNSSDAYTQRWARWGNELIWENIFGGGIEDREQAIAIYNANIEAVKSAIDADRLLVFQAKDGWQPLCDFLQCDVPDIPYPRVNSTEEFLQR